MRSNSWVKRVTMVVVAMALGILALQLLFPFPEELPVEEEVSGTKVVQEIEPPIEVKDETPTVEEAKPEPEPDYLKAFLESMTLEEKVGQMFLGGSSKQNHLDDQIALITNQHFGGLIIMRANVTSPAVTKSSMDAIEKAKGSSPIPLLVAIDEEGGSVTRLYGQLKEQTGQNSLHDLDHAYGVAFRRGGELRKLGINMNFSPVMDVIQKSDSFMYNRAFLKPHRDIGAYGDAMLQGYQGSGVIGVMKHFPGHPSTEIDSHDSLPVNNLTPEQFDDFTKQFRKSIDNNSAKIIMTGHISYPNVDPHYPASLSSEIIEGKLREEYGFEGVVITDDLNMGAVRNSYSIQEGAIRAIEAGNDIVLLVTEPRFQKAAYEAVLSAARSGRLTKGRIDDSVYRILLLKEDL